jgi:enoyl reductase-like protein
VRAGDVAVPMWAVLVSRPDEPVTELLDRLADGSRIAVVVAGGEPVGVVTRAELARAARPRARHDVPSVTRRP